MIEDFEDMKALHYLAQYRRGEIKLHPVEVKQFEAIEALYQ